MTIIETASSERGFPDRHDRHEGHCVAECRFTHRSRNENRLMEVETIVVEETPERAAESIAAALDFLRGEAEAAGLSEVGDLIQQASATARERSVPLSPEASPAGVTELEHACRAIVGLPDECRKALVFKKVYRRSYEEIANDCSVSVDVAKDRVIMGFRLLRASW